MKKVAILGWHQGSSSFGVGKAYLEFLSSLRASAVILSPQLFIDGHGVSEEKILNEFKDVDLLLLPGGLDVDPRRYGAVPGFRTQNPNIISEWFDTFVLPVVIEKTEVPIVGICRGMQTLAVHFGASMVQDYNHPTSEKHRGEIVESLALNPALNKADMPSVLKWETKRRGGDGINQEINSLHHQHVDLESLEHTEMTCWLVSSKTGTPEVIVSSDERIVGFQYHPEEIFDHLSFSVVLNLLFKKKKIEVTPAEEKEVKEITE